MTQAHPSSTTCSLMAICWPTGVIAGLILVLLTACASPPPVQYTTIQPGRVLPIDGEWRNAALQKVRITINRGRGYYSTDIRNGVSAPGGMRFYEIRQIEPRAYRCNMGTSVGQVGSSRGWLVACTMRVISNELLEVTFDLNGEFWKEYYRRLALDDYTWFARQQSASHIVSRAGAIDSPPLQHLPCNNQSRHQASAISMRW